MESHLHLAWYGYSGCQDPVCDRPRADPADDMDCTDPDCEGGCEAARRNTERRKLLPHPWSVAGFTDAATGETLEFADGTRGGRMAVEWDGSGHFALTDGKSSPF